MLSYKFIKVAVFLALVGATVSRPHDTENKNTNDQHEAPGVDKAVDATAGTQQAVAPNTITPNAATGIDKALDGTAVTSNQQAVGLNNALTQNQAGSLDADETPATGATHHRRDSKSKGTSDPTLSGPSILVPPNPARPHRRDTSVAEGEGTSDPSTTAHHRRN